MVARLIFILGIISSIILAILFTWLLFINKYMIDEETYCVLKEPRLPSCYKIKSDWRECTVDDKRTPIWWMDAVKKKEVWFTTTCSQLTILTKLNT